MKFQKIIIINLNEFISVAHVRPKTFQGITNLLLPQTSIG